MHSLQLESDEERRNFGDVQARRGAAERFRRGEKEFRRGSGGEEREKEVCPAEMVKEREKKFGEGETQAWKKGGAQASRESQLCKQMSQLICSSCLVIGRHMGRGGGNTKSLQRQGIGGNPSLILALSYSLQIMAEGVIAVTPNEVSLDALVSPAGVISISQAALESLIFAG
ncbi:5-formyltetrahydrofolate cyclo-ligase, mitochondrial [Morella rubra]|uniref:5-formyltetrahydrofolate cyclo-ligase, mitochondrial n=1 Tax=Morella rubra TaxID=262757 RepID=A0A6A1VXU6_9ROSI|nr:5-formyltetrahydrofolate cyclo-ligase, mitochondrial [Morella rubra]